MRDENEGRRRDALLGELRRAAGRLLSLSDLMTRAKLHPGERTEAKRTLRELAHEGLLLRDGKRFAIAGARPQGDADVARAPRSGGSSVLLTPRPRGLRAQDRSGETEAGPERAGGSERERAGRSAARRNAVVGTLKKHRDGFGFVARLDRKGDDVFVPPAEAARALDGDLVRLEIVPARGGRTAGRIVEVVERRRRLLVGTYHARGARSFVLPADAELDGIVPVPETTAAVDGEVVKVALDPESGRLQGTVVEAIGQPGEPRVEVLKVAYARGFADVFPEAVQEDAVATPDHVRTEDWRGRRDLTGLPLVTIDGEDARDFDDAVHVERLPASKKGKPLYRLVVAIADVAHYVRPGMALDAEAARRGTSVYFPMQVLPMLPERLSNGICSLNPEVDRLCMVADMVIDGHGEPKSAELYEGVMRSAARCTYTEVAKVLDGERVPGRERFRETFELMAELQEQLTAMRRRRGALDFDLPEAKIVLDRDGHVAAIEKRPRNRAHRIVEEFMLAANEAVARGFGTHALPTIYRVHGSPDEEKLQAFLALAATHGFDVPELPADPRELNHLLESLRGHPQQRALNQLLLRAMMQAVYTPENIGHYGLAAEHYLHFTSPIRRYPDLVVHRLLKEEWARRQGRSTRRTPEAVLEEIAILSSERERAAMEAEREIAAFYAALFMKDKVGDTFEGVVSSVVDFGIFVELRRWFVEGLVRAEDLRGAFELDPVQHALVDRASGRAFRVGDPVEVEVMNASPARRRIELRLVGEAAAERPAEEGERRPQRLLDRGPRRPGERGPKPGERGPKAGERRGTGHAEGGRRGAAGGGKQGGKRGGGPRPHGGGKGARRGKGGGRRGR